MRNFVAISILVYCLKYVYSIPVAIAVNVIISLEVNIMSFNKASTGVV